VTASSSPLSPDPEASFLEESVSQTVTENLQPGVTYYFRAVATNAIERINGEILEFTTSTVPQIALHDGSDTSAPSLIHNQAAAVDFGATTINAPIQREFTITNTGEWRLTVDFIAGIAGYTVNGVGGMVASGETMNFTVTFDAAYEGVVLGEVKIISNDPETPEFVFPIKAEVLKRPVLASVNAVFGKSGPEEGFTLNAEVNPNGTDTAVWIEYTDDAEFDGVIVSTLAGSGVAGYTEDTGTAAQFDHPHGLTVDANRNVYLADTGNHKIRRITPQGLVTTLAGSGTAGYGNGTGSSAHFNSPEGLAIDANGNLYVADTANHVIRKVTQGGEVTNFAGITEVEDKKKADRTGAWFNYHKAL